MAALTTAFVGFALTAASAGASSWSAGPAVPTNQQHGGHWWAANGCGSVGTAFIPDRVPGTFDFTHACIHHDGCYGHRFLSRLSCDERFRSDMKASCEVGSPYTYWWNKPACRWAADVYYNAVRTFGSSAYG